MTPEETRAGALASVMQIMSERLAPNSTSHPVRSVARNILEGLRAAGWVDPEEAAAHEGELGGMRSQLSAAEAERDALLRERAEHEVKQADVEWLQKRAAEAFAAADIATRAAEQACAERDRDAAELRDKRTDLLDIRGLLSPNGGERVVPFDLGDAVAPAVEYLISEVRALLRLREAAEEWDQAWENTLLTTTHDEFVAACDFLSAAVAALNGRQDQGGSQARPEDSASQVTEADHG